MIRLSGSGIETWISPTFSHPAVLGTGPTYVFNHMKGRTPDTHLIQLYNANNTWSEVYNYWQNASGSSYFGFSVNSTLTDENSSHITFSRFASSTQDYRAILAWF